jgi:hypothetical protein
MVPVEFLLSPTLSSDSRRRGGLVVVSGCAQVRGENSTIVAAGVRRWISARKALLPPYLGGYGWRRFLNSPRKLNSLTLAQ